MKPGSGSSPPTGCHRKRREPLHAEGKYFQRLADSDRLIARHTHASVLEFVFPRKIVRFTAPARARLVLPISADSPVGGEAASDGSAPPAYASPAPS